MFAVRTSVFVQVYLLLSVDLPQFPRGCLLVCLFVVSLYFMDLDSYVEPQLYSYSAIF